MKKNNKATKKDKFNLGQGPGQTDERNVIAEELVNLFKGCSARGLNTPEDQDYVAYMVFSIIGGTFYKQNSGTFVKYINEIVKVNGGEVRDTSKTPRDTTKLN